MNDARKRSKFESTPRFVDVIRSCAARADTWINDEIVESYTRLHEFGHAHSVEAWSANELVGGLYGVAIGGAFFGESMFHRTTGASKIALWALVDRLRERRFALLDTQWLTPHLKQFGAREIPRQLYLHLLKCGDRSAAHFRGRLSARFDCRRFALRNARVIGGIPANASVRSALRRAKLLQCACLSGGIRHSDNPAVKIRLDFRSA